MAEEWKDIPGYEGKYQASTLGRIRGLDRLYKGTNKRGRYYTVLSRGRLLRTCVGSNGYLYVGLRRDPKVSNAKYEPVHHLVAKTFIGERPPRFVICHGDGNKKNNSVENLRYAPNSENLLDIYRCGGKCAKLTVEEVREIKQRLRQGETRRSLATRFGVSYQSIDNILKGRRFAWVEE